MSNNPTIAQIVPNLESGGAERTVLEISESLVMVGARAITISTGGRLVPALKDLGGVFIPKPVATKNPFSILSNAFQLARLIRSEKIDLVHARSRAPAWSAYIATKLTSTPFLTTYHSNYTENSALKKWYNSVMVRGQKVIANSEFIAALIRERYDLADHRIATIPRGIDPDIFSPSSISLQQQQELRRQWNIPEHKKIILHAARLSPRKGQTFSIAAIAELRKHLSIEDYVLVLAGDPQGRDHYVEQLQNQIHQLELEDCVRLVGHCDDMKTAFSLAHLAIVSTIVPEAFGRAAVEAQALQCPVVVTDSGAATETVVTRSDAGEARFTGWRVAAESSQALAEAMFEALSLSDDERAKIGRRAREHVIQNFNLKTMKHKTLEVYDEILGTNMCEFFAE